MARAGLSTEKVVAAGARLADEAGFDAVTMSALARHLGVRTASLYSHLADSADLRARIAALALDELAERAGAALAGRAGRDALLAFADSYRDYAREHPGRWAATRHGLPADLPTDLATAGRAHAELSLAILRGYGIEGVEATHAVRLIGSVLRGFTDLELAGSFAHSGPPSGESWSRVLAALDATLRRW